MATVAIITARGGSKRIPNKNRKPFCGKPIIAYSIEAALKSGCFDEVMVSTDSEAIAAVARSYGADVPFMRSASASSDVATTADAIRDVLQAYADNCNKVFEVFCCIYPTAPFVTAEKIRKGMNLLLECNADSIVPVVQFDYPPQRGFVISDKKLRFQFPEYKTSRSQDLAPIYHDCGQFYVCRTEPFLRTGEIVTDDCLPMVMPGEEVQDIDYPSDWETAEIKYCKFIRKEESQIVPFV